MRISSKNYIRNYYLGQQGNPGVLFLKNAIQTMAGL